MRILDSNLIIHSALPDYAYLRSLLKSADSYASEVTRLEVPGFHRLDVPSRLCFESAFATPPLLGIDRATVDEAIRLRQERKMSVGDAIVAATARLNQLEVYTRNVGDFKWIPGLKVINPIL